MTWFDDIRSWLLPTKRLIASGTTTVKWTDQNCEEYITWLFFEDSRGRRSYRYLSYGFADDYDSHERWLGSIERWKAGGKFPSWVQVEPDGNPPTLKLVDAKKAL